MPTIEWNRDTWGLHYNWAAQGEEWSRNWGSSEAQWFWTIYPRIHAFLPARTILEIAPGFGRWTRFLRAHCERLMGVDLSLRCVEACRERFVGDPSMVFHQNDGRCLEMVEDETLDFAFSFDSLVHADESVLRGYLGELAQKLTRDGVGFIHHSNLGMYAEVLKKVDATPAEARTGLFDPIYLAGRHCRDEGMSADRFVTLCDEVGLACVRQELVSWGRDSQGLLIDCFSSFVRKNNHLCAPLVRVENPGFMQGVARIRELAKLWLPGGQE